MKISESHIEERARGLAQIALDDYKRIDFVMAELISETFVNNSWHYFRDRAKKELENEVDSRLSLLELFLANLNKDDKKFYTKEYLHLTYSNAIYLILTGSHEERIAKMKHFDIPELIAPDNIQQKTINLPLECAESLLGYANKHFHASGSGNLSLMTNIQDLEKAIDQAKSNS